MTTPTIYIDKHGSGPDLILLHGWAMHGGIWEPVVNPLAEAGFRVHVVDLPGHGRSEPLPDFTLPGLVEVLLDQLPKGAIWAGWSLGGLLAMEAARVSDGVSQLLLIGTSPRFVREPDWPHGMEPDLLRGFARELSRDWKKTLKRFLSLQLGSRANLALLRRIRERFFDINPPHEQVLNQGLDLLEQADLRAYLGQLQLPSLVIHGQHDRLVPVSAGQYLADHLPHARLQINDQAGHLPFLSHQDWFLQQTVPLLNRC